MSVFIIKDSDGNEINRIVADAAFVEAHYEFFEEERPPEPTPEEVAAALAAGARVWRDSELSRTDILVVLPDYPNSDALLAYRQALRDWPDTADFPDTRPVL